MIENIFIRIASVLVLTSMASSAMAQFKTDDSKWEFKTGLVSGYLSVPVRIGEIGRSGSDAIMNLECSRGVAKIAIESQESLTAAIERADSILIKYWPKNFETWRAFGKIHPQEIPFGAVSKLASEVALHDRTVKSKRLSLDIKSGDVTENIILTSENFSNAFSEWEKSTDATECLAKSKKKFNFSSARPESQSASQSDPCVSNESSQSCTEAEGALERPSFVGDPVSLLTLTDESVVFPFKYDHLTEMWNSSVKNQLYRLANTASIPLAAELCNSVTSNLRPGPQADGFYIAQTPGFIDIGNKSEFRDSYISSLEQYFGSPSNVTLFCMGLSFKKGDWLSYAKWALIADRLNFASNFLAHAYLYGLGTPRDFEAAQAAMTREFERTSGNEQKSVISTVIGQFLLLEPSIEIRREKMTAKGLSLEPQWHEPLLLSFENCIESGDGNCRFAMISFSEVASRSAYERHINNLDGVLTESGDWVVRSRGEGGFIAETYAAPEMLGDDYVNQSFAISCKRNTPSSAKMLLTLSASEPYGVSESTVNALSEEPKLIIIPNLSKASAFLPQLAAINNVGHRITLSFTIARNTVTELMSSTAPAQIQFEAEGRLRDRMEEELGTINFGLPLANFSTSGATRAIRSALERCNLSL